MSDEKKNQPDVEKEALADEDVNEQMQVRLDKMHKLEEKGILPFGHAYQWTHHTKEVHDQVDAMEAAGTVVKVAGVSWPSGATARPVSWISRTRPARSSCMSGRTNWAKKPTAW